MGTTPDKSQLTASQQPAATKPLCPTCAFHKPMDVHLAGKLTSVHRCDYGVRQAPQMVRCGWYQREPGSEGDDE